MAISFENNSGIGVVTVHGTLTAAIAESFRSQFAAWHQSEPDIKRVVIDLGGVTFMDSTGLGAVIGLLKRVAERGGDVTLARPQKTVKLVFQITGADRIMKICETLEEALKLQA
jgi:anti-anti-sigma factor